MLLTSILVQGKRRNKVLRESLHQVRRVGAPKRAKDLVQRKRKNKGLRESLHQIRNGKAPKKTKNLVQRKRKNKGLRESLHQVQRVEAPKRTKDLVQEKRKNKGLRESLHQVRSGGAPLRRNPMSEILYVVIPPTRIPYFLAMKEAAVPSAQRLLPYIMLFWSCKFKGSALATRTETASPAKPFPLGRRPPTRRSPARSGSAPSTRRSLRLPARRRRLRVPRLHRPSWDVHREGGALARDAAHVNRCVMD